MSESKITDTSKTPNLRWLFGGNPRAIEHREAQGQQELINSSQLPSKINDWKEKRTATEVYEEIGIKVVGQSDDLFLDVVLPDGWSIKPTDHSVWSKLLNDKGEEVASIFYKAAFYDRGAFINIK